MLSLRLLIMIFVGVDRGVRFGVSLITLIFVSCGACYFDCIFTTGL